MENEGSNTQTIIVENLSPEQKEAADKLQKEIFGHIDQQEIAEDFFTPRDAHVMAYENNELVGYAAIYHSEIEFEGRKIKLGGFGGLCTRKDKQGKGIGTLVSKKAIDYLKKRGDDLAFLSIDLASGTRGFYEKLGFVLLPRDFSWMNSKGELKKDRGGMIAPLNSQELYELVLSGHDTFYVGKGYW